LGPQTFLLKRLFSWSASFEDPGPLPVKEAIPAGGSQEPHYASILSNWLAVNWIMLKVLAYLVIKAVVASLLQWYSSACIAKDIFHCAKHMSSRSKLSSIGLMIFANSALLFLILWGDTIFGPDFTGRQFLAVTYISYLRLVLAFCLFFAMLKALAYIFIPLEPRLAGGEPEGRPDGPRMEGGAHEEGVICNHHSSDPSNFGGGEHGSAQGGPGFVPTPRLRNAVSRISRRGFLRWFGAAGVAAGAGTMGYGLSEAYQSPVINEFELSHQSLEGLRRPITIIQVTDFHFGWFWGAAELNRLVGMLNSIEADAVVLTGDIFHSRHTAVESAEPLLRKLIPRKFGNYVVMGNHELYVGADRSLASFRHSNLTHLGNRWISLEGHGAVIHLGGLDDPRTEWAPTHESGMFARLIDQSPRSGGMRVLLCHRPSILPLAAYAGIDLVLAGHTHGGQMIIPWPGSARGLSPAVFSSAYTHGWYRKFRCKMYLNKGVGLIYAPWRINCPPEIGIFHLLPPSTRRKRALFPKASYS
jgi:uncharacterized protein